MHDHLGLVSSFLQTSDGATLDRNLVTHSCTGHLIGERVRAIGVDGHLAHQALGHASEVERRLSVGDAVNRKHAGARGATLFVSMAEETLESLHEAQSSP